MVVKVMHDRVADVGLVAGIGLSSLTWIDALNKGLDALAAIAAIVASVAAAIYYFKGKGD